MVPYRGHSDAVIMSNKNKIGIADRLKLAIKMQIFFEKSAKDYEEQARRFELTFMITDVIGSDTEATSEERKTIVDKAGQHPLIDKLRDVAALCQEISDTYGKEMDNLLASIDAVEQAREVTS